MALAVSLLPPVLATCCAPPGRTGLGTVWFVNDFSQYESAMRQGTERADWLVRDPFTAEPHGPAFMFPLYVGLGKLATILSVPPMGLERLAEVVARTLFLISLWRFCATFTGSRAAARAAFLLALFGSGLGFAVTLVGQAVGVGPLYGGSFSYETSTFGLLFAAPHVPLAMAVTLELARWLVPGRRPSPSALVSAALLGAGLALLHPFHEPVLLGALLVAGLVWWRTGTGPGTLLAGLAASAASLPVLLPTAATFTLDPFWSATYGQQNLLPSPAPHELFVDVGVTLALAIGAVWLTRGRGVPFGLGIWLLLGLVGMYLPVPYQRRLAFGLQPAVAVLAGSALVVWAAALRSRAAAALRLSVAALAAGGSVLIVAAVVGSLLGNAPIPVYRSTTDLDAAAAWLSTQVRPGQVVAAEWDAANYLAARTDGSVFGGHPVATLDPARKRLLVATLFAHVGDDVLARQWGIDWMVFGPDRPDLPRPRSAPAFESGTVSVYRVPEAP